MRLVRDRSFFGTQEWRDFIGAAPVGVTIGNFDGMHLGHQALFSALTSELAGYANAKRILVTFAPHPRRFLSEKSKYELDRDAAFGTLSSVRDKLQFSAAVGFDAVFFVRFNTRLANLEPERFVSDYLQAALGASIVVVGHDWCFGKGRAGTAEKLKELAPGAGFRVTVVPPVVLNGERVGSRLVKSAIEAGAVQRAVGYLGRNYSLSGRVRHGDKRGRKIGYPTANLEFVSRVLPKNGVYATLAHVGGETYDSVTNVGVRPTFTPPRQVVEVHLFTDTNLELYGDMLTVEFVHRLRDEQRFSNVEELTTAIRSDVERAGRLLATERS